MKIVVSIRQNSKPTLKQIFLCRKHEFINLHYDAHDHARVLMRVHSYVSLVDVFCTWIWLVLQGLTLVPRWRRCRGTDATIHDISPPPLSLLLRYRGRRFWEDPPKIPRFLAVPPSGATWWGCSRIWLVTWRKWPANNNAYRRLQLWKRNFMLVHVHVRVRVHVHVWCNIMSLAVTNEDDRLIAVQDPSWPGPNITSDNIHAALNLSLSLDQSVCIRTLRTLQGLLRMRTYLYGQVERVEAMRQCVQRLDHGHTLADPEAIRPAVFIQRRRLRVGEMLRRKACDLIACKSQHN